MTAVSFPVLFLDGLGRSATTLDLVVHSRTMLLIFLTRIEGLRSDKAVYAASDDESDRSAMEYARLYTTKIEDMRSNVTEVGEMALPTGVNFIPAYRPHIRSEDYTT